MSGLKRDIGLILALLAIAMAAGYWIHGSPGRLPPLPEAGKPGGALSLQDFRQFVEEKRGPVLDARSEAEYREGGHVPGALWLPIEDFDKHYAALKSKLEAHKDRPIAVYCSTFFCKRSAMVQKKLRALGFTEVSVFSSGWSAWHQAGLPEER